MSNRKLYTRIVIEPFQFFLYLAVGPGELIKFIEKKDILVNFGHHKLEDMDGFYQEVEVGPVDGLLYLSKVESNDKILVHEALHVVHHILDSKGVPISAENTEVMAYMQEYVIYEIEKALVQRGHLPKGSAKREGRRTY